MGLAAVVLALILVLVLPRADVGTLATSGSWTLEGGLDLLFVALIQCFSYPFHDPVMTDRGFITDERTMLRGFVAAGLLGVVFITLFSLLGVYGGIAGVEGNSTFGTAAALGLPALLLVNVMMLTSASSTLDSTFASVGKLAAVDLTGTASGRRVRVARGAMVVLALLGGLVVHAGPAFGIALALGWIPGAVGEGRYGNLLFVNIVGVTICFVVFVGLAWSAPGEKREVSELTG